MSKKYFLDAAVFGGLRKVFGGCQALSPQLLDTLEVAEGQGVARAVATMAVAMAWPLEQDLAVVPRQTLVFPSLPLVVASAALALEHSCHIAVWRLAADAQPLALSLAA